jgi:hypothetical protein
MTNQPPVSGTTAEISQGDAVEIAARKVGARPEDLSVILQDGEPAPFKIYNAPTEPCWWIVAPHRDNQGVLALRSSRVLLVGRRTGVVHYDGSANDEG